jgi:hypothetical protein
MARGLVAAMALAASVCGCSSGGGDGGGGPDFGINCTGLTGATASAQTSCVGGCGGDFSEAAVDGDLGTYAILQLNSGAAGSLSIRATAAGVTYPAGTPAAVVYGIVRTGGDSVNTTETITTYLEGTPQETGNTKPPAGSTNGDVEAGRRVMATNLPFDAIEVTYAQTGGTAEVELQVYEFCTSTN